VALKLWLRTHDAEYRQESARMFSQTLADPQFSLKDFYVLHHFGELALHMKAGTRSHPAIDGLTSQQG
jgi:hypothetical protein